MYVAFTKKKYKDTYHKQILLRESYREDDKVKTRTIANLTNQPKNQVEAIVAALKNKDDIAVNSSQQFQGCTIGLSFVVIFLMKQLGIFKTIGKGFKQKIAMTLIAARVSIQSSRLQALSWAQDEDKILDLLNFSLDEKNTLNNKTIYQGLDYLYDNKEIIENKLFKAHYKDKPPTRVFYDVTSSYVEGEYEDSELVAYGYNRDGKKSKQQIVIGLLADENGHAISIDTYPGNTNDIKTFADQLDKLKNRFKLKNITIVGDGGMIKSEDIATIKDMGYDYITSIGKPSIKKLIDNKDSKIQMGLFDEDLKELIENNTRYILRQNPIRRDEIAQTRESKIKRLQEFIDKKQEYYNTKYRAKQETLQKHIEKKLSDLKLSGFISIVYKYEDGNVIVPSKNASDVIKTKPLISVELIIDEVLKKEIAQLDGCYVVTTSLIDTAENTKEDIHKAYKTLIKVENAFKTLKTEYLEIRPLYLRTDSRIKAHIFCSMLAYNIVLKLKSYTKVCELDFKKTIRELSHVKTVKNKINDMLEYETIPQVNERLCQLFKQMELKLPKRI